LALEPEHFENEYAVWHAPRRGSEWTAFKALHEGRCILNGREYGQAVACAEAVLSNEIAVTVLGAGVIEKAITWEDKETGILCKGRPDHSARRVTELKVTAPRSFPPKQFAAHCANMGYHAQLMFYHDGLLANGEQIDRDPLIVVVESEPPHDVAVYRLSTIEQCEGRAVYRRCLYRLAECQEENHWPGITGGEIKDLTLPGWAIE
jgi:exodeoxyribonuclease VIII